LLLAYSLECAFYVVAGFQFLVFGARSGKHKNWLKSELAKFSQTSPKKGKKVTAQLIDK